MTARAIGIDLGTTHSAVAAATDGGGPEVLSVPQVLAPGEVTRAPLLGSFLYAPSPEEFAPGALALPWNREPGVVVGDFARRRGAEAPARLVSSAKSWLCHAGVDREAAILPADAPEEVPRISPVAASAAYLGHLVRAWDAAHPTEPMATASVVLTVPASFDPVARELTVKAAAAAGLPEVTLLEEPQAALYSWIAQVGDRWREHLSVGDVVLVVDVGGGTTDFSLIAIDEEAGRLAPRRLAVGDHILLGGDNMDLALAHVLRERLAAEGKALDAWQMRALTLACRDAKERLLADDAGDLDAVPVALASRGSRLIGGTLRTEVTLLDATRVLLEGFFPDVPADAAPIAPRRGGLVELGLPYAQDPGVTRHLAGFLGRHGQGDAAFAKPTHVLFNGGVFKSGALRRRLLGTLNGWLAAAGAAAAKELPGGDLDLACARGAASFAEARAKGGVRIRGGTARAYYVGVEAAVPAVPGFAPPVHALCLAPFGMEEGADWVELRDTFGLVVGEPVRFRFFGSSVRREDTVGTRLTEWRADELEEYAALEAALPAEGRAEGAVVPVRFRARVNELGALELGARAVDGGGTWRLSFELRAGGR